MDFSKIKLDNERCGHLKKRLNRLSAWKFFQVLYRNNMARMFGMNFLMLITVVPVLLFVFLGMYQSSALLASLPYYGSFGSGTGIWTGVAEYYAAQSMIINHYVALLCVAGGLLVTFMFSGGFAIVRDSFWTGNLKIFKCFGMGVKSNILYALISSLVIGGSTYGCLEFYWWVSSVLPLWAAIILEVIVAIIAMFVIIYCLILCSVTVTYKQSVKQNLDDSWRLLWLNVLPNILHFILAILPIGLYLFLGSALQILILVLILMFGGFYVPFIWQTHMMKTFALFHPVQVNKKGETKETPQTVNKLQEA